MPRTSTQFLVLALVILSIVSAALTITVFREFGNAGTQAITATEKTTSMTQTTIQPTKVMAPSFILRKIDGSGLTNNSFTFNPVSGKVTFIEFVLEWCPHCRNMVPIVEKLHERYGDKVEFITVTGGYRTTPEKTAEFIRKYGISWTAVYDEQMEVFRLYRVTGTPTYFIISPDGAVFTWTAGEQTYEYLSVILDKALERH
jgi:cytochrome c biogenesis protein CcmG/thiol:disulfide interchange protein DsbE